MGKLWYHFYFKLSRLRVLMYHSHTLKFNLKKLKKNILGNIITTSLNIKNMIQQ